jgi:hypothetical protein
LDQLNETLGVRRDDAEVFVPPARAAASTLEVLRAA